MGKQKVLPLLSSIGEIYTAIPKREATTFFNMLLLDALRDGRLLKAAKISFDEDTYKEVEKIIKSKTNIKITPTRRASKSPPKVDSSKAEAEKLEEAKKVFSF
jgi:hypothetical protein